MKKNNTTPDVYFSAKADKVVRTASVVSYLLLCVVIVSDIAESWYSAGFLSEVEIYAIFLVIVIGFVSSLLVAYRIDSTLIRQALKKIV